MGSGTDPRPMDPRGGPELDDGPEWGTFEISLDPPKEGAEVTAWIDLVVEKEGSTEPKVIGGTAPSIAIPVPAAYV